MLIESLNHILILSRQKKENLNRMREIQIRATSADNEQIKYNTNRFKTGSSKNIDLLKVKRRHSWIQWSNKIQQHFCWRPVNHCYECVKRKTIQANMRNKFRHKKAMLCGSLLKFFGKGTKHESQRI